MQKVRERRNRGNVVAIVLAGLAVVLAMGGTAVAVTTSKLLITDAKVPSRTARVDQAGRLTTGGYLANITYSEMLNLHASESAGLALTNPTTATLAVTHLTFSNSGNAMNGFVELNQVGVDASGKCLIANTPYRTLITRRFQSGESADIDFANPLSFAPVGGRKYCIAVWGWSQTSTYLDVSMAGLIISGTYTPKR